MTMTNWNIYLGEKAAERADRIHFSNPQEVHLSLDHFLNHLATSEKPILSRRLKNQLVFLGITQTKLRYFTKLNKNPFLTPLFSEAIARLQAEGLTPENLEPILETTGSLKEYDLHQVFKKYEESKKELGVLDTLDQYAQASKHLSKNKGLGFVAKIIFHHFMETPTALKTLLKEIGKHFPKMTIEVREPPILSNEVLSNVSCFSLPSPHQEALWFCEQLLMAQENPSRTGILMGDNPLYYETIWEKLKPLGLTEGVSPFLKWKERPEGRRLLQAARQLRLTKKPPLVFLEKLLKEVSEENLYALLDKARFSFSRLDFGEWEEHLFLRWLEWTLDESPRRSLPNELEGIQWIGLNDGDFPNLDSLWVPGLSTDQFPLPTLPTFFADPIDRSKPEWSRLVLVFEDPKKTFAKQRRLFHAHLSGVTQGAWITLPRLSSFGKESTPSPLVWDFEITSLSTTSPHLYKEQPTHLTMIEIEKEREQDRLETKSFHADLAGNRLSYKAKNADYPFSATQLETYAACPFKFYAQRILKIPQVKEFSPEVDANDKGTLFHKVLETLFCCHLDLFLQARKNPRKKRELFEELTKICESVFAEYEKQLDYANRELYARLKERIERQAFAIIEQELEKAHPLPQELLPQYFETQFDLKLNDILLHGFIDRIDVDEKNRKFLVLDYKTGTTTNLSETLKEGLTLQLPIYIYATQKKILPDFSPIGGLLISIKTGERKHGLLDSAENGQYFQINKRNGSLMEREKLETAIDNALGFVTEYVEKIRNGYFSAQPKNCEAHCDYKEICRYAFKPKD